MRIMPADVASYTNRRGVRLLGKKVCMRAMIGWKKGNVDRVGKYNDLRGRDENSNDRLPSDGLGEREMSVGKFFPESCCKSSSKIIKEEYR